jgi:hypothetical protein
LFFVPQLIEEGLDRPVCIFALVVVLDFLGKFVGEGNNLVKVKHADNGIAVLEDVIEEGVVFADVQLVVNDYFVVLYLSIGDLQDSTQLKGLLL